MSQKIRYWFAKLTYFLFLFAISGVGLSITWLPLFVGAFMGGGQFNSSEVQLLVTYFGHYILIFLLFIIYFLLFPRVKNTRQVFAVNFMFTFATGTAFRMLLHGSSVLLQQTPLLLLFEIVTSSVVAWVATYIWEKMFISKKYSYGFVLIFAIILLLIGEVTGLIGYVPGFSLVGTYVPLGNWLIKVTDWKLNIFFFDWSGWIAFIDATFLALWGAVLVILIDRVMAKRVR